MRQPRYIQRLSTAVPDCALRQDEAADQFAPACAGEKLQRLVRRAARLTGIETRHLAALAWQAESRPLYTGTGATPHGPGMGARTAAFDRAADPLVRRVLAPLPADALAAVEHLVTVNCTQAASPGLELHIHANAPLRPAVHRWNLGFMGCSGGLAGLRLAHALGASAGVLVLACELCSLHFQYATEIDQWAANLLFADGAAAVLLGPAPGPARIVAAGCVTLPAAAQQMRWTADDFGLRMQLAPELPETLAAHLPGALGPVLDAAGWSASSVRHWLVHPGGPQILDRAAEALDLPAGALEHSRGVLRRYGNMSSPTILFILGELLERRVPGRCVAVAFGPGLTIEMVLIEIGD